MTLSTIKRILCLGNLINVSHYNGRQVEYLRRVIDNSTRVKYFTPMEQVIYVVKCLSEGQDKAQIIGAFEDDEQLVSIWIQLAKELAWLESQN